MASVVGVDVGVDVGLLALVGVLGLPVAAVALPAPPLAAAAAGLIGRRAELGAVMAAAGRVELGVVDPLDAAEGLAPVGAPLPAGEADRAAAAAAAAAMSSLRVEIPLVAP
ncbi:MAG: hypothetical protein ACR2LK_07195 [Solirubrobacteraceae bacterium]